MNLRPLVSAQGFISISLRFGPASSHVVYRPPDQSMSRLATPYDNARAESFMKTLKSEEVYRTEYRDLEEARALIKQFLEKVYNQQRLHSALGYRPPLEFERSLRPSPALEKRRA